MAIEKKSVRVEVHYRLSLARHQWDYITLVFVDDLCNVDLSDVLGQSFRALYLDCSNASLDFRKVSCQLLSVGYRASDGFHIIF